MVMKSEARTRRAQVGRWAQRCAALDTLLAGSRCAWMRWEAGPITDAPPGRANDARGRGTAGTGPGW